jgi:NADH:ubiquinone oxidoreductase subunit E
MANNTRTDIIVSVCTGTGGVAAGGYKVIEAFQSAFTEKKLAATFTPRTHKVGCRGFCAKDVLVDVSGGQMAG